MTTLVVKTTLQEADDIAKGMKPFIFRNIQCGYGDEIQLRPYKDGKMTRHPIEKMKFMVTYVSEDAPIERGFKVIALRRLP